MNLNTWPSLPCLLWLLWTGLGTVFLQYCYSLFAPFKWFTKISREWLFAKFLSFENRFLFQSLSTIFNYYSLRIFFHFMLFPFPCRHMKNMSILPKLNPYFYFFQVFILTCRDYCPLLFSYFVWQKGYFHPFPHTVGILSPLIFILLCCLPCFIVITWFDICVPQTG